MDQAALVATTNTDLDPLACKFMSTGAAVKGEDINLYLMQDNKITKWQAIASEQPGVAGVYAYGLKVFNDDDVFTFSFNSNADVQSGYITIYDTEGKERQIAEQRAKLSQQRLISGVREDLYRVIPRTGGF